MKYVRDNFPRAVKQTLAARVNHRCSNPLCGATTSGPQVEPAKTLNIGVAAHITAAAFGGPRYDSRLTKEQRSSGENGIWLCQNCAKLVDNDRLRHDETMLRRWKELAETNAREGIGRQSPFDRSSASELNVLKCYGAEGVATPSIEQSEEKQIEELRSFLTSKQDKREVVLLDSGHLSSGNLYAILGIGQNLGCEWEIGIACAGDFGWEVIAQIGLSGQKGFRPNAIYVLGFPGALVLTHVAGYGTGVFRQSMSWYRISRGRALPLLSYPVRFYVVGWQIPFDRQLTSRVLSMPSSLQSGARLELEFATEYTIGESSGDEAAGAHLFSTKQRISLEWNDEAGVFVPCTANDDLGQIDETWNESTDGFVSRNFATIQRLAADGTSQQRQFVQKHLLPAPASANNV